MACTGLAGLIVVALEELAGFVVHEDVEDGEEKARIGQACETGVVRYQQALCFVIKGDVCGIRPRQGIMGGVPGFWAGPLYFVRSVPLGRRTEILLVPASAT